MILGIDRKVRLEISGDESLSFWEESEVVDVDRDVPGQLTLDLGVLKTRRQIFDDLGILLADFQIKPHL